MGLLASGGFFVISIHDYLQGTVKEIPFISKSFIYVALISFLIYIIRIIIKIIVSSQHMSMEYEQKAALTFNPDTDHVMLCGNPQMVDDTKEALKNKGLTMNRRSVGNIAVENYW